MNKVLTYQQKKISYRRHGKGDPVVLLHGFGEDGDIWKHQAAYLQKKYSIIIPDLPGSGNSEMVDDMSIEGMAEVIHAIIHHENITTCTLIGHSMGGYITLAFAEKYWNHLNAFGLFHSSAYADTEEKKSNREKSIGFIQEHSAFEFLKTAIPNLFSPDAQKNLSGVIQELIYQGKNFTPDALIAYYRAMIARPDRISVLKNVPVPVLFIMGKYDNAVPLSDGLKQCHLPEKSYIHILQKAGHMGMLEETDISNRILDEFLLENVKLTAPQPYS